MAMPRLQEAPTYPRTKAGHEVDSSSAPGRNPSTKPKSQIFSLHLQKMSARGSHVRSALMNLCKKTYFTSQSLLLRIKAYVYFNCKLRADNHLFAYLLQSLESAFLYLSARLIVVPGTPEENQHIKSAPWQLYLSYFSRAHVIITTHAGAGGHWSWVPKFTSTVLADMNIFLVLATMNLRKIRTYFLHEITYLQLKRKELS